ncbi:hypothetical protein BKA93DRAFT_724342 [Sparassis latifolia]
MGNSTSSSRGHHEDTVDFGYLNPQGVYTGPKDWNQAIVAQLIGERKLAPFYRPLEDYDESWDDEQILAARREPPDSEGASAESSSLLRAESLSSNASRTHHKRASNVRDPVRHPEAAMYRGAVECPICFLYYPPNINHSRCCDQTICTECFVQMKRADPTTTHLVSEPASCPYCVQDNFGIVYTPPPWRTGLGSEGATPPSWPESPRGTSQQTLETAASAATASMKRRRKSLGHDSPEVVTIDMIRPDWEAKLTAVRAAVARRANRRIIMRQVGDRLIPVGVTSGRIHALPTEDGQAEGESSNERGSRRSRRRPQNQDINQLLGSMGLGGQDLEELMVMEAMRLSLIDHEEQQKREREEAAKKEKEGSNAAAQDAQQGEGTSISPQTDTPSSGPATVADCTSEVPSPAAVLSPALTSSEESTSSHCGSTAATSETGLGVCAGTSANGCARVSSYTSLPPTVTANTDQSSAGHSGPSSPSYSTLSTAMLSATSTANAIPSPADTESAAHESMSNRPTSRPRTPVMPPGVSTTDDAYESEPFTAKRIPLTHADSIASSIDPSSEQASYDILSSSPESSASHKPLLGSTDSTSPPFVTIGADSSSAE